MTADAEAAYHAFDWTQSREWKEYHDKLFPAPPLNKLDKYKRRFYRQHIDESLPEQPPAESGGSGTANAAPTASPQPTLYSSSMPLWSQVSQAMYAGAVAMTLLSFLPLRVVFKFRYVARLLYFAGAIAGFVGDLGVPRLNQNYWSVAIYSAHVQAIAMTLLEVLMRNPLARFSPAITGISYIAQKRQLRHPVLYRMQVNKPYVEIMVGFVAILTWFSPAGPSVFSILLYWNTLRFLYNVNAQTKSAFGNLHRGITTLTSHPKVSPTVAAYYQRFAAFVHSKSLFT